MYNRKKASSKIKLNEWEAYINWQIEASETEYRETFFSPRS